MVKPISPGYLQLAKVFEALEKAKYIPNEDFGALKAESFAWYICPQAVKYLNSKNNPEWLFLKYNGQFNIQHDKWLNQDNTGVTIKLIV